jgi:hypothetical protein
MVGLDRGNDGKNRRPGAAGKKARVSAFLKCGTKALLPNYLVYGTS